MRGKSFDRVLTGKPLLGVRPEGRLHNPSIDNAFGVTWFFDRVLIGF